MTPNNKPKNLYLKKFGRLSVIGETPDRAIVGRPKWFCKCDCGNELWVDSYKLLDSHTKSCGCLQKESRMKKQGEAGLNAVIRGYKKNAQKRNLLWELSDEQVKDITSKSCFYCDAEPKNEIKAHVGENGRYLYNGIDRLDNNAGYTINNVVPCCYRCNILKKDFSINSMVKVLTRLGYKVER